MTVSTMQPLGRGGDVKIFSQIIANIITKLMNNGGVCRAAPGFARIS